uniref:probable ATP-dependent DNA helicase HFM1 n=1 Tax=Ciona intestinalis TaxID=7719 RepID=UPI0002B8D01E
MLVGGIGYHHAGLDAHDRHLVEEIFLKGDLLVLVSTSTLAMGVNLPAHLVVVKSTCHYVKGTFQEYTQSEILQMTGRAGRPQFDESATAVIMTREHSKNLYQNIVNGSQKIESSLHSHLIEHLNAEIVLMTICDVSVALEWIRSTFLYIRLLKNPTHYGYPEGLTKEEAESKLLDLCSLNLSQLQSFNLISIDKDDRVMPNEPGRLM